MTGLGYKQLIPYLEKEITLEEAAAWIKQDTHQYARRQRTWFKRDPGSIGFQGKIWRKNWPNTLHRRPAL